MKCSCTSKTRSHPCRRLSNLKRFHTDSIDDKVISDADWVRLKEAEVSRGLCLRHKQLMALQHRVTDQRLEVV
eukprot:3691186-Amphidinium_carterae.1